MRPPLDLYRTLELTQSASEADLKAAHRRLTKLHHPDRGGDPATFVRVQQAYEFLKDGPRRARYDRLLAALLREAKAVQDKLIYKDSDLQTF